MVATADIQHYIDDLLQIGRFRDYAPNGLQVAGNAEVSTIVTGVTACQPLIDQAIAASAELLLVHHGYFWKGEDPCIVGMKRQRIASLLSANMNLLGYHLPLDAHEEFGNNVQLARILGMEMQGWLPCGTEPSLVAHGELATAQSGEDFAAHLASQLGQMPLHIPGKSSEIKSVAWCTGGAQDFIDAAIAAGCDAYITGEVSERTFHSAMEMGIHFYAAGHHATERYGVQALGKHLADHFGLQHQFIDIPNPV